MVMMIDDFAQHGESPVVHYEGQVKAVIELASMHDFTASHIGARRDRFGVDLSFDRNAVT